MTGSLLRLATAGAVDDGKSTLIGRLLHDAKAVPTDQLEHVQQVSRGRGDRAADLALLTDGLRAEREQGITIDVAYRSFATPRRRFIIADTPGHVSYTRNMVTGASTADLAIVLIDARKGVLEQSRRHAFVASLLRVPHLVVCVNKMDLVGWERATFESIVEEFETFSARLEAPDVTFIPVSALHGDNVVERSRYTPWYDGPPLLYHLEHVHVASDRNLLDTRLPVQLAIRTTDFRGYAGQLATGILRVGDPVVVLPSGQASVIAAIDGADGALEEAFTPMSVVVRLRDELDVARGDLICRPHNRPDLSRDLEANLCWLGETPAQPGRRYALKHTTRSARATLEELRYRIDVNTLHRDRSAAQLERNEIGRVRLRTSAPLAFDPYARNRATGSFILIDEVTNDTVGAGMITGAHLREPGQHEVPAPRTPRTTWHPAEIDRQTRWEALGQHGATVWLTGLPSSGKSTIATALEARLIALGRFAYVLDGDNLRHGLNGDLGFSARDRAENVRRAAQVARLMADAGALALVALVSPFAAHRDAARALHEAAGLPFLEVWVSTPAQQCERRDPKGLYARARAGALQGFTGVNDPYEPPDAPDLELDSTDLSVGESVERLLDLLRQRRLLPAEAGR